MTRFTVDSDVVAAAAAAIGATAGRIQGEAASLHSQLDALQGVWTGSAATAFQAVVQRWRAAQADLEQALAAIDQSLRTAGAQYAEIELANARLFG
jgi:WXG100 family type VII secretion target